MTELDRQKRPALAVRRASGTSTRLDRGAILGPTQPLSERLNRADDHSAADVSSLRSPSFSAIQGMSKLTRSTSSHPPAASLNSQDSSRSQSVRSISGSVETAAYPGTMTSTASPLVTPADDLLQDPLLMASKRSFTASPLLFEGNNGALSASPAFSVQQHRDAMTTDSTEGDRMGVKLQRRNEAAGSATSATKEPRSAATTKAWTKTNTALRWIDTSILSTSSPLSTPAAHFSSAADLQSSSRSSVKAKGQGDVSSKQGLSLLTQRQRLTDA
jgi:hypothetical protein